MRPVHRLVAALMVAICASGAGPKGANPQEAPLAPMLKIDWREGPEYPLGIQDSAFGVLDGVIISASGLTRHPKDVVKHHPDANRRAVAYDDRYILLIGGSTYENTWHPDQTRTKAYTPEDPNNRFKIENTVYVFDTRTGRVGTADPLVDPSSFSMAAIDGTVVYTLGGEGGRRMWHPAPAAPLGTAPA